MLPNVSLPPPLGRSGRQVAGSALTRARDPWRTFRAGA